MIEGRIIKGIGGFYYVDTDNGLYECRARGIFRKNKITPLVGDFVKISVVDEENKKGVVEEIAERENLEIVIILTKIDLDNDNTFEKIKNIYEPCGYKVIGVSNLEKKNIDKVKEELKDNTVVFAGPSGVGKSSLLNEIDKNFKLKTGDVSDKIKRGKHTTRHAELFELEFGGMVADTPGFSSLTLDDIEDVDLKDYFIEFDNYDDCKFGSRCIHQNEPNCAVKEAVENGEIPKERYESYIQLLNEIRQGKRRY